MKKLLAAAAFAALSIAAPSQAATLVINSDGKLTGATGVQVGSDLYNVSFTTGTCAGNFSGCDSSSDFTFKTSDDAFAAVSALASQVFAGIYDTNGGLTCSSRISPFCDVIVPYQVFVSGSVFEAFRNNDVEFDDFLYSGNSFPVDQALGVNGRFAVFSFTGPASVTAPVPEPSTWAMMMVGFGAIGASMRRRRRVSSIAQMA
nr:PEPxxWA-CTERM sorting domain-containing protein [uncultured Sphingomonas sp.]